MRFNKIPFLMAALMLINGCAWLRDKPKPEKKFTASALEISCLQLMPNQLKLLFSGKYTAKPEDQREVKAIWECLDKSLNTFTKYTHGSNSNSYTAQELQSFANRYLPADQQFTASLVDSIFKLKKSVLGGTEAFITREEVEALQKKLNRFGEIILPLAPHFETLLKPYSQFNDDERKAASEQLSKFVTEFAKLLSDSKTTVTWFELTYFIGELEDYLKPESRSGPSALAVIKEQIQIFQHLKMMIVGGDRSGIENSKWEPIFKSISLIYNALFMTKSTSEMMEELKLDIKSTEEERTNATIQLTATLKKLKNDPSVVSKRTISLFADRWSKLLLLNAYLFPKSTEKLCIKQFLDSPSLRKLTAYLIDEVELLQNGSRNPKLIKRIGEHAAWIIEKSSLIDPTPFQFQTFKKLLVQLRPLIEIEKEYKLIDESIQLIELMSRVLIGNEDGRLTAREAKSIIVKLTDLYAMWMPEPKPDSESSMVRSVTETLRILMRDPAPSTVSPELLNLIFGHMQSIAEKMKIKTEIKWDELRSQTQLMASLYKNFKPIIKNIPTDFKMGINSQTLGIIESAIQSLIESKIVISNIEIKKLLHKELVKAGYPIREVTIETLLIGLNHRVLLGNKGKKPTSVPATINSSKLLGLKDFIRQLKLDLQDIELAFRGVDKTQSLSKSELALRLNREGPITVLNSLHPILSGKTGMPYFTANGKPQTDYYFDDILYKNLLYRVLHWVLPAYVIKTKANPGLPRLNMPDLVDLITDLNDAVYELGLSFSNSGPVETSLRRMQSINLFTRTGNGDEHIDVIETIDFLTTTSGGKCLLDEVRKVLVKECYPNTVPYTAQKSFSYGCIKNVFFSKSGFQNFYEKVVPEMSTHYLKLSDKEMIKFQKNVLTATRADWTERSEFDLNDLETMVSIPFYVENIFERLDHDYNGILNFTEAMSGFPVFCGEIKKAGGSAIRGSCVKGEDPKQVEAIYGHLLFKGVPPRGVKPGDSAWEKAIAIKDFLLWTVTWNRLDKNPEVRNKQPPFLQRKDLLNVISNLATSIDPGNSN